jgi:hypothetical protein
MSLLDREGSRAAVNESGPAGEVVARSAVELTALMRSGELSPVEVTDAFLTRAEHAQQAVNPFTFHFPEQARAAARRSERRLRAAPDGCGLLEGLPVAIKELTPVAGQPLTLASLPFKDQVAEVTDPAVQRLLDAGVVIHARTNTPEFGCARSPTTCSSARRSTRGIPPAAPPAPRAERRRPWPPRPRRWPRAPTRRGRCGCRLPPAASSG